MRLKNGETAAIFEYTGKIVTMDEVDEVHADFMVEFPVANVYTEK